MEPFFQRGCGGFGTLFTSIRGTQVSSHISRLLHRLQEAVPLKDVTAISITKPRWPSFLEWASRGKYLLSDYSTQFTSYMGKIHRLLVVKLLFTPPYHPSGSRIVKRLHTTLKASLRKLCSDKLQEWHHYLPVTLFTIQEMPGDQMGFPAFKMLYARTVRGPPPFTAAWPMERIMLRFTCYGPENFSRLTFSLICVYSFLVHFFHCLFIVGIYCFFLPIFCVVGLVFTLISILHIRSCLGRGLKGLAY